VIAEGAGGVESGDVSRSLSTRRKKRDPPAADDKQKAPSNSKTRGISPLGRVDHLRRGRFKRKNLQGEMASRIREKVSCISKRGPGVIGNLSLRWVKNSKSTVGEEQQDSGQKNRAPVRVS